MTTDSHPSISALMDAKAGNGHHAAHAALPAPPYHPGAEQVAQLSRWGRVHADVTGFGRALLEMGKVTGAIVSDPRLEELIDLAMAAAGLGAKASDIDLVLVQLRHIVATLQDAKGSGPQPAFLPAPADGPVQL